MKRFLLSSLLLLLAASALRAKGVAADEFDTVVTRCRTLLADGYASLNQASTWSGEDAAKWITTLDAEGRWPDIDYANRAGGAWETLQHLRRVRVLAREFTAPRSPHFKKPDVQAAIGRALEHWTTARYQNPNWWQNQIGVPQVMRDIIVLLGDQLTGEARAGAMAVLHQFVLQPPKFGANTVWSGELALITAALEHDASAFAQASQLIAGEVVSGGEQGIQDDFSFHQHGARLQQFHYGGSFFEDTVRIAWLLRGTSSAFSPEKVTLLADFAVQGSSWMSRGSATVPGTLDRAVSRPRALAGADQRKELRLLGELLPERAKEFAKLTTWQKNRGGRIGFRAFPRSDFAVHQSGFASFFLKTISTRTEVTETILRENRLGRKLNWGDHYILTSSSDYTDLPPVWNWDLLPGVTSSVEMDSVQRQPFAGSVSDGGMGATAMDYRVGRGEKTTLTARKLWAMKDGMMIGLVGALETTETAGPVRTALDQRRLRGDVTIADVRGQAKLSRSDLTDVRHGVKWIHHDGLLYVPIGSESVTLLAGAVTGSWRAINLNHSDAPVTESIFMPVIEHGREPHGVASGFIITACKTPKAAAKLFAKPTWKILRNDAAAQAVEFSDGALMAVFYEPGQVSAGRGLELTVDRPCLVLVARGEIRLSDPTGAGQTVTLRTRAREFAFVCPSGGKTSEPVRL